MRHRHLSYLGSLFVQAQEARIAQGTKEGANRRECGQGKRHNERPISSQAVHEDVIHHTTQGVEGKAVSQGEEDKTEPAPSLDRDSTKDVEDGYAHNNHQWNRMEEHPHKEVQQAHQEVECDPAANEQLLPEQ